MRKDEDEGSSSTFMATMTGIKQAMFPPKTDRVLSPTEDVKGKTCLVTGSNTGLGFAIATELAKLGGHIIMAIRSGIPEKGEEIKKLSGNPSITMEFVELSELASIKDLVLRLKEKGTRIDILVCNAGMVSAGVKQAKNGLDLMFAVNYLSNFYFVNLLLEHQVILPKSSTRPRLIFVSSEAHRVDMSIDTNRFGQPINYSASNAIKYYGYYKLFLNIFIVELNRRYANEGKDLGIFSLCPGAVHSNIAREAPNMLKPILWLVFKVFFQNPNKAACPVVYFACSSDIEETTDIYLHMMQEKRMAEPSYDIENGKKVWEASEQLIDQLLSSDS